MTNVQFILTMLGAGVAFVNYLTFLIISRHNSLPFAPIVLLCVTLPFLFCLFFGRFATEHFPVLYEILKWIYISIGLVYSVSFFAFSFYVMSPVESSDTADVIIVFGCKTFGYTPSYALQNRLDKAYEMLENNPGAVAILSGGQGEDETVSEAESMRAYLEGKGISADRLILEDRSTSTRENIEFSMNIIKERGREDKKITAVSNDFHIKRILRLFKERDYDVSASPAHMKSPMRIIQNLTREYMVWVRTIIF